MKDQLSEESLDKISSSTSYRSNHQDDEIDLLQLLLELWKGKKIIMLSVVVFVLIGTGYVVMNKIKPSSYILSVTSKVEVYDYEMIKLCQRGKNYIKCLDNKVLSQYSTFLPSWDVNTENLIFSRTVSHENQDLKSYQRELDAANANVTQYILDKTKKNLSVMDSLNPILQSTEVVAESILQAKQALSLLGEEGSTVVTFGKLNVNKDLKQSTKSSLVIILSAFLGVFCGILALLFKRVSKELRLKMEDDSKTEI